MVTILPPATSLSTMLGQGLGAGLGRGIEKGSEVGFQRGLLQNALKGLENIPQNASPLDVTKYLLSATAGLPDQGRVLQALAPYIIGGIRGQQLFGGNAPQGQQNVPVTPQTNQQEIPQQGGYFLQPKTPQQQFEQAQQFASLHPENPVGAYVQGLQLAGAQNESINRAWQNFESQAVQQNPNLSSHPERLPFARQIFQKFAGEGDPAKIMSNFNKEYGEVSRLLDVLGTGYIPGATAGAIKKIAPFGIVGSLMAPDRDKAIRQFKPTVDKLIKMGFEPQVRSQLAQEYKLSPTEIEEVIHPLSDKTIQSLNSFPPSGEITPNTRGKKLGDFFRNNITPDTSLLALRHRLWNDKGYNWEDIGPAIRESGAKLTPAQETEMFTIDNDPPIQSLPDIFRGFGRWIDYLRGAK